jgi:hypothetical protein
LQPLAYTIEALCRAGYARDPRLKAGINVLLASQRANGGWCRSLSGDPGCTMHAMRALGSHPDLRRGLHAERALRFVRDTHRGTLGKRWASRWGGAKRFALLAAVAAFPMAVAREIAEDALSAIAPQQRRDGSFGGPSEVERVAAVLGALRAIQQAGR